MASTFCGRCAGNGRTRVMERSSCDARIDGVRARHAGDRHPLGERIMAEESGTLLRPGHHEGSFRRVGLTTLMEAWDEPTLLCIDDINSGLTLNGGGHPVLSAHLEFFIRPAQRSRFSCWQKLVTPSERAPAGIRAFSRTFGVAGALVAGRFVELAYSAPARTNSYLLAAQSDRPHQGLPGHIVSLVRSWNAEGSLRIENGADYG